MSLIFSSDYFQKVRFIRIAEMVFLYVLIPILYTYAFPSAPLFLVIFFAFLFCLIVLLRDSTFPRKWLWTNGFRNWKPLLLRFAIFAAALTGVVLAWQPEKLLYLVFERPWLMLMIALFYPIFSAYPQEVIYRAYFYHRFTHLFPKMWMAIAANAFLFAIGHLIFDNWIAIVSTFFAGLLFSLTYLKNRSLFAAFAEHSLYGDFVYFIGVGEWLVKMN